MEKGFVEAEPKPTLEHPVKKSINEIINIKEENGEILISGRELHEFLDINSNYTTWITRMCEYGFEENEDYTLLSNFGNQTDRGGHNKVDHALKLDMAKEIAMLQRNAKGKQARKYFIDCERRLKAKAPALPTTYKDALVALVAEVEAKEKLEAENKV